MLMRLLYAEDEKSLSEAVVDILTYHGFTVDPVYNGADALDYAKAGVYDGIILDIMMPERNGIEVLGELRKRGDKTPVLLLTAKSSIDNRVEGLDAGADDYLVKPFAMKELVARVRAMLRRKENYVPDVVSLGTISLNRQTSELSCGGQIIDLPRTEFLLLETLIDSQDKYLTTEKIYDKIWGYDSDSYIDIVWVNISYLRKRLEQIGANVEIVSKKNTGYRLELAKR